jgi:hypothetical protein
MTDNISISDNEDKTFGFAKSKNKRRIRDDYSDSGFDSSTNTNKDLADQVNALQKAFAQERGEWERYRQEMRTKMHILIERSS